jgi:hypothetical protein
VSIVIVMYIQYIFKASFSPGSVQQIMPYLSSSGYGGNLVTFNGLRLTAAKFKPRILPVPLFALSNIADMCIFITLNDLGLLPAQFGCLIVHVKRGRCVGLTTNCLDNVGSSTSHNPIGFHGLS